MTIADPGVTTERIVLAALSDRRWHSCCEIADDTKLLPVAVRATLKQLGAEGLVSRSLAGAWMLTAPPGNATDPRSGRNGR
jgi:predicted ArsR family transcriptional regulator